MKHITGIWQNEGNTVFKLKESGAYKRNENKELVPVLENEVVFLVQVTQRKDEPHAAHALRSVFTAEEIVKKLNSQ